MSGPVAGYVILPTDSGNTGKQIRTQTKVVGGQTVHEHYFVAGYQAVLLGKYIACTAQKTVAASAENGTTTGTVWAHMPNAVSNKKARLRRIVVVGNHIAAFAATLGGRINLSRFTFTGTASGATITAGKVDSGDATPVLDLRTANTGLTVTLVATMGVTPCPAPSLTAVGAYNVAEQNLLIPGLNEDFWPTIGPGEGFVAWQDQAGTTSDSRVYSIQMHWDEIDTA